jgi:hypothetical protein
LQKSNVISGFVFQTNLLIIAGENADDFHELRTKLVNEFKPKLTLETELVASQVFCAGWADCPFLRLPLSMRGKRNSITRLRCGS